MSTQEDQKPFVFPEGYYPDQPLYAGGVPGTIYAGLNVAIGGAGLPRTIAPPLDIAETYNSGNLGYTANLGAGDPLIFAAGGSLLTDLVPFQIILLGGIIYVVEEILSNTQARISPPPAASLLDQTIRRVPTLHSVDNQRAGLFAGNVVKYRDEALFTAGLGEVKFNGAALSATLNSSTTPQVAYPKPDGTYDSRPVGFTKPASTPSLTAIAGGTKNMPTVAYSIKITKKRLGFPGYGLASEAVEQTIASAGQRFQLTLPAFDASEGQTSWLVWATKSVPTGSAQRGPWFLLGEFTTVTPSTVNIEWRDDELQDRLVDTNSPPPKALFVASMDDALIFGSCFGKPDSNGLATVPGPGFAVAKPDNPEGFTVRGGGAFTSPAEDVRGMMVAGSRLFALSANRLHVGTLTGSDRKRLVVRPYWSSGFWHQYNGCVVKDVFYGFTGSTLTRTKADNDADSEFSERVKSELEVYVPQRVFTGHDPRNGWVVVFHSNHRQEGGFWITRAIPYNYKRGKWNAPVDLVGSGADFTVCGVATVGSELHIVTQDGKTYRWDAGSGTVNGFLAPIFQDGGSAMWLKTLRRVRVTGRFNGTLKLYKDYDKDALVAGSGSGPSFTVSNGTFKTQHAPLWKPNFDGLSIALRIAFSMPAKTDIIDAAEVKGVIRADANF
jgi:hypothetical protein